MYKSKHLTKEFFYNNQLQISYYVGYYHDYLQYCRILKQQQKQNPSGNVSVPAPPDMCIAYNARCYQSMWKDSIYHLQKSLTPVVFTEASLEDKEHARHVIVLNYKGIYIIISYCCIAIAYAKSVLSPPAV